jgi:hypothetical protein
MTQYPGLNDDFRDLLLAFAEHQVDYLVVGAHAMAVHGVPRATGDLDILVRPTPENADRVIEALRAFGAPLAAHGVTKDDFVREGNVYQIGLPPRRIDVLTQISGVTFDEAWADRTRATVDDITLDFIGRTTLLRNKKAAARDKDLVDVRLLEQDPDEDVGA